MQRLYANRDDLFWWYFNHNGKLQLKLRSWGNHFPISYNYFESTSFVLIWLFQDYVVFFRRSDEPLLSGQKIVRIEFDWSQFQLWWSDWCGFEETPSESRIRGADYLTDCFGVAYLAIHMYSYFRSIQHSLLMESNVTSLLLCASSVSITIVVYFHIWFSFDGKKFQECLLQHFLVFL